MAEWPTISSVPPGATPSASRSNSARRCSSGRCMKWAVTRSNAAAGGVQTVRSACTQVVRPATSPTPVAACVAARCRAVAEKSTPVTRQPRAASQSASAPSPLPTSSAEPAGRSPASSTSAALGSPLQTADEER